MCFRMVESESMGTVSRQLSALSITQRRESLDCSLHRLTTYLRRRAAATGRACAGSSRSDPHGSCCARPSDRAQPPASQLPSYLPHAPSQSDAAFPPEKNLPTQQSRPADWQSAFAADPIPAYRQATVQAESSPNCAPDMPAARRECGALHIPSSSSCGKGVVRWNEERLSPGGRQVRK